MTKEEVYDTLIHPLIAQIQEICEQHKLSMLTTFQLDGDMACTTALLDKEWGSPAEFYQALDVLYGTESSPMMITKKDSDGKITKMVSVI